MMYRNALLEDLKKLCMYSLEVLYSFQTLINLSLDCMRVISNKLNNDFTTCVMVFFLQIIYKSSILCRFSHKSQRVCFVNDSNVFIHSSNYFLVWSENWSLLPDIMFKNADFEPHSNLKGLCSLFGPAFVVNLLVFYVVIIATSKFCLQKRSIPLSAISNA